MLLNVHFLLFCTRLIRKRCFFFMFDLFQCFGFCFINYNVAFFLLFLMHRKKLLALSNYEVMLFVVGDSWEWCHWCRGDSSVVSRSLVKVKCGIFQGIVMNLDILNIRKDTVGGKLVKTNKLQKYWWSINYTNQTLSAVNW